MHEDSSAYRSPLLQGSDNTTEGSLVASVVVEIRRVLAVDDLQVADDELETADENKGHEASASSSPTPTAAQRGDARPFQIAGGNSTSPSLRE